MDWHVALAGLLVGIAVGFSGVGGSALMMPVLVLMLGVQPLIAVGTDLAYSVPTKLVGMIVHWRQNTVRWKLVLLLAIGGVPGALGGIVLLGFVKQLISLDELNVWLKHALGALLFMVSAIILFGQYIQNNRDKGKKWVPLRPKAPVILLIGLVVGFLVSLTSIGAGSIAMTALFLILPLMRFQQLVGSSVAFAAIIVPIAAAGHWALGSINFPMTMSLLVGSIPGVIVGSRLCGVLPDNVVRPATAVVMALTGTRMF
ncbi:MAG TPA: sulfite exporter TauE/SafE family protein [Trinickia sp.]|nr:sulfite exporter TauE/SafE family protein [Trinickia sp.]